ncbi:MFS transporter [uncultured Gammaproteobacteria bacterium]
MSLLSARLSVLFAWVGHATMHILTALYLTVVLVLEQTWHMSYDDLIRLWTIGALLIGLGAPLAGGLGDRWSESRMMVVFFLLTGGGSVAAGLCDGPQALVIALAVLGLGGSIYHPVGLAWVVRNATNRGKALGYMGIFGSIGTAVPALIAGSLSEAINWRAAFLIPGAISVAFGLALLGCIMAGIVVDPVGDAAPTPQPSRGDAIRAFVVLSVTMLCGGLIWGVLQVAMPKLYDTRLATLVGDSALGVGGLVTLVYLFASGPQLLGGHLADHFPVKKIYITCLLVMGPLLALTAGAAGLPLLALSVITMSVLNIQIPSENLLLARYTPSKYRGLAYGAKFVLTFGIGPVAVQMTAAFYQWTGEFRSLLLVLTGVAALAGLTALLLPAERLAPAKGRGVDFRPVQTDD